MHYRLTEVAYEDLGDALAYLSTRSASAGEALALNIRQGLEMLVEFPDAGRTRPEFTASDVRFWPVDKYFIVYQPQPNQLEVLAILHASRNLASILAERFPKDTP